MAKPKKVKMTPRTVSRKNAEYVGRLGEKSEHLSRGMFGLKDKTCYYDPMGARVSGGVNLLPWMRKQVMPGIEAYQETMNLTGNLAMATQAYTDALKPKIKTLQSSAWNIPIFAVPRVSEVTPGNMPLVALTARQMTNKDQVQTTPRTSYGAAELIAETDKTYTYNDDVYHAGTVSDYTFTVYGWGRANSISELMNMVGESIQSPGQTSAIGQLIACNQYLEKQIFQGTGSDASSFDGIEDWAQDADGGYNVSGATIDFIESPRLMLNTLFSKGANPNTTIGATDSATLTKIANEMQSFVKTGDPYKNFVVMDQSPSRDAGDISIRSVQLDGVPFMASVGATTTSTDRQIIAYDAKTNYLVFVQDATLKPLAKTGPFEHGATDMFGTFASEGKAHVGRLHTIT